MVNNISFLRLAYGNFTAVALKPITWGDCVKIVRTDVTTWLDVLFFRKWVYYFESCGIPKSRFFIFSALY